MTLYIYSSETGNLMARIHGDTNAACEGKADELYGSNDYEWAYSQKPARCDETFQDYYV